MIQFNLLPDIKLDYIKTRRTKRSIVLISAIVTGVALAIFILLFMTVNILQKQHMNNLNNDIKKYTNELKGIEDLDRILTVQNQLNKLTELHDTKPVISRFKGYISQITPAKVNYASITLDLTNGTIQFTGGADSLKTVNQFVDTLKFTKYTVGDGAEGTNAFTDVVLAGFGKDDKGATYDISLKFDPTIFASQSDVKLVVPNIVTTRSAIERPDDNLILPLSNPESTGGQ